VLQCVYQYFSRVGEARYDATTFDAVWHDLIAEMANPDWVERGVANVRCFDSKVACLALGDGIEIRARNFTELKSLGFDDLILERLEEDWSGFGASRFMLISEQKYAKTPQTIVRLGSEALFANALKAIWSLRLAGTGSVSIGPMWLVRPARFNVGIAGLTRTGWSIPALGSSYIWTDAIAQAFPAICHDLTRLEMAKEEYAKSPGNLQIALKAFMGTYDRWPLDPASQLVDAITALDALLIKSGESIRSNLASRVAGLVAATDEERVELTASMKGYYDARSAVVHGDQLKPRHLQHISRIEDLRAIVRLLLRTFIGFAATPKRGWDKSAFRGKGLDTALADATRRAELRRVLKLGSPP
jgi:hypothetical protein